MLLRMPDAAQPRAHIVTVYGLYARDTGWLPISLLVRLLAELDVDEPAVRSAISRLKREATRNSRFSSHERSLSEERPRVKRRSTIMRD